MTASRVLGPLPFFIYVAMALMPSCICKPKANPATSVESLAEKEVNLAIWANYISEAAVKEFTAKSGIRLNISNYSSNEELLAKIQAGGGKFDLIVPSDYMVSILKTLGLLQPIEKEKLKNLGGVEARFLGLGYDPGNDFSVPYTWTVTGMGINRNRFQGTLSGWSEVFSSKELKGQFSLLDDSREVFAIGLRLGGKSINSTDAAEIEEARRKLSEVKPHVKAFTSEPMAALLSGDLAVAQIYSSDALQARKKSGGKIDFVFPKEGATMAIDNLVIPKGALHPEAAHRLIDFLLSSSVSTSQVANIMSGPILKNAKQLLPDSLQADETLFPSTETLKSLEMMEDVGDASSTYDRMWTELKAL